MKAPQKTLLSLPISNESDVLLARRRTRQVANLLGFDEAHQQRLSLALSEIVKYFLERSDSGHLDFNVEDTAHPMVLRLVISGKMDIDHSPYEPVKLNALLTGDCTIDQEDDAALGRDLTLRLGKTLSTRSKPFTMHELSELTNTLDKLVVMSPLEEISQQNQELISNLEQIKKQKEMLDDLKNSLEQRVEERTAQLLKSNAELEVARDEAIKANELKSQFVANISHEIRTPMCGILGLTEELLEISDNEESRDLASFILNSARDLMRTVNDLLDFSKIETTKLTIKKTPFDLADLSSKIMQSVLPSAKTKGLEVQEYLDPQLKRRVIGDYDRISQILLNLVHNAIKFTHDGRVDLRISLQNLIDGKQYVQFEIQDTGIGISDENLERLFVPYVQAESDTEQNFGGTGLGLAICKSLVQQMGGVISCDSAPGVGSCFSFTLPLEIAK